MVKKKFPILIISILFIFIGLTSAITFQQIFPTTNPFITPLPNVTISTGVNCPDGCSSFTHSWNGTNTTLYDSSLVLFMNFDNRSALGEFTNSSTGMVRDLSMYNNNGTIVGINTTTGFESLNNITWGSTYGKYGGAFNFSGNKNTITIGDISELNYTKNYSFVFWINPKKLADGVIISDNYDSANKMFYILLSSGGNIKFAYYLPNTSEKFNQTNLNPALLINNLYQIIVSVNPSSNNLKIYINGVSKFDGLMEGTPTPVGSTRNINIGSYRGSSMFFNGTIEDVMIFNRSLSASEIEYLYRSQITKYNESYFEYNVTNNNISANSINSFLCSKNATAVDFCSGTNVIRENNIIKSNFSTSKGLIKTNFYGINTHGQWGSNLSYIDVDDNGVMDTISDYEWHRNAFLNSNINFFRVDTNLQSVSLSEGVLDNTSTLSNSRNINTIKNVVLWANITGSKVLLIGAYTPDWLANKTDGYCNLTTQQNYTCRPYNYTKWTELLVDYLDAVDCDLYPNNCYLEVWNEPANAGFWLNNLSTHDEIKAVEMIKLVNATLDIKDTYPLVKVGGVATADIYTFDNYIDVAILSNFSSELDFWSTHIYYYSYSTDNIGTVFDNYYNHIFTNLTYYNFTGELIISEVGILDDFLLNSSDNKELKVDFASLFISSINNVNRFNFSSIMPYQWSNDDKYMGVGSRDEFVSEPLLNNTYYIPYNVTKNFAHLCPAGATVYVTSGDDSDIKQVSCKKGNQYSLIVINTGTEAKNVTLNMSMNNGTVVYPYANLVNYEDDTTTYKVSSDGISQLGVMDSYEILYLYSGVEDGALLRGVFKLNEYTGNTLYDSLQNLSNGVKSGATWITDGILNTLTSGVDYTISTSGLFVVSSSYLFNYMDSSWSYLATWRDTGSTASLVMVDSLGNSTTFLSLLIVISFAVVILTLFKPSVNTNPLGKPHY